MPRASTAERWVSRTIAGCAVALAAYLVFCFFRIEGWATRPPFWDQAAHGWEGLVFAHAIRTLDPFLFLKHLGMVSYWPPLYAFVQVPAFLTGDYGFWLPRALMAIQFLLVIIAIIAMGRVCDERSGLVIGAAAAVFAAMSPTYQTLANDIMLEIPGTLLGAIAFYFYGRYLTTSEDRYWRATCWASAALFFCKYNYGIMWIGPMVLWQLFRTKGAFGTIAASILSFVATIDWRRPFSIFVTVYVGFLLAVKLSGGWDFDWLGWRVKIHSPFGNPLYFLVVIVILRYVIFRRQDLAKLYSAYRASPREVRLFIQIVVMPILVWLAYPANFQTFFLSIINQDTRKGGFTLATLLFHPKSFAELFSPNAFLGGTIFVLAWFSLFFWKRMNEPMRFALVVMTLNYLACVVHPNQISRYLFTVCPYLWLAAAYVLWQILHALTKGRWLVAAAAMGLVAAAIGIRWLPSQRDLEQSFASTTLPPDFSEMAGFICDHANDAAATTVISYSARLSPSLVKWECLRRNPALPFERVPETPGRLGIHLGTERPEETLARTTVEHVVLVKGIGKLANAKGYWWNKEFIAPYERALEQSPRFESVAVMELAKTNYHLESFKRLEETNEAVDRHTGL